jgi:CheY-like chemotaxis protein
MQTILIVDDEYTIAETLSEILAYEGFEPRTAANGQLGLESMEAKRPDLVLLDYMMPVMDGMKMIRAMKADPRWARIPVILMTAAPPKALQAFAATWDALLRKPFDADHMMKVIRDVLARSSQP